MPVRSTPMFLQAGSHPAEETRLMIAGLLGAPVGSFSGGTGALDPSHGVTRSDALAVSQNGTPNMSVNVAAGGCFIRGTLSNNQGSYFLWNDGTLNAISSSRRLATLSIRERRTMLELLSLRELRRRLRLILRSLRSRTLSSWRVLR